MVNLEFAAKYRNKKQKIGDANDYFVKVEAMFFRIMLRYSETGVKPFLFNNYSFGDTVKIIHHKVLIIPDCFIVTSLVMIFVD